MRYKKNPMGMKYCIQIINWWENQEWRRTTLILECVLRFTRKTSSCEILSYSIQIINWCVNQECCPKCQKYGAPWRIRRNIIIEMVDTQKRKVAWSSFLKFKLSLIIIVKMRTITKWSSWINIKKDEKYTRKKNN